MLPLQIRSTQPHELSGGPRHTRCASRAERRFSRRGSLQPDGPGGGGSSWETWAPEAPSTRSRWPTTAALETKWLGNGVVQRAAMAALAAADGALTVANACRRRRASRDGGLEGLRS